MLSKTMTSQRMEVGLAHAQAVVVTRPILCKRSGIAATLYSKSLPWRLHTEALVCGAFIAN